MCAVGDPVLVPGPALPEEDCLGTKLVKTFPLITKVSSVLGISLEKKRTKINTYFAMNNIKKKQLNVFYGGTPPARNAKGSTSKLGQWLHILQNC